MLDRRLPNLCHRRGVRDQHVRRNMTSDQLLPSRMQRIAGTGAEHRVLAEHQHRSGPRRKPPLQVLGQRQPCHLRFGNQQKASPDHGRSEAQQHERAVFRDTARAETDETLGADVVQMTQANDGVSAAMAAGACPGSRPDPAPH